MLSTRYLPALAIVLALASVPTILHRYVDGFAPDGLTAAAVPADLAGLEGRASQRSLSWVPETFATDDFVERRYGTHLTLFIARSYDAKRLYHHPELAIAHGDRYERAALVYPPGRPDVAIHVLNGAPETFSAYVLLYAGQVIDDPIRFQFRNALALLFNPRKPMTLIFVRSTKANVSYAAGASLAEKLLLAALDAFTAQQPAPLL